MKLRWRRRSPRHIEQPDDLLSLFPSRIRLHREIHRVADGFCLETFWKTVNGQQGPGATVYVLAEAIMCFDCLGDPLGHFHGYIGRSRVRGRKRQDRIHFAETTVPEQVRRGAFEVRWNFRYYQHRYRMKAVQRFDIDDESLANASNLLRQRLDHYCEIMPDRFAGVVVDDRIFTPGTSPRRSHADPVAEEQLSP